MTSKQQDAQPVVLSDQETAHVAGGDNGNHVGQRAQQQDVPAWTLNPGKAEEAAGHLK